MSSKAIAGAEKYSQANSFNLPSLKRGCYREALQLFNQALTEFGLNGHPSDRTGTLRNAAMACLRIHQTFVADAESMSPDVTDWSESAIRECQHYLLESFQFGCQALNLARNSHARDSDWCLKLSITLADTFDSWLKKFPLMLPAQLVSRLTPVFDEVSNIARLQLNRHTAVFRSELLLSIATRVFDAGVLAWSTAISDNNDNDIDQDSDSEQAKQQQRSNQKRINKATIEACSRCIGLFSHADRMVRQALALMELKEESAEYRAEAKPVRDSAEDLITSIDIQKCICAAVPARINAEKLLQQCLNDYEDLPLDLVWQVIDSFKHSAALCQEKDIEAEAMALAQIGKVYLKVLKVQRAAYVYFDRAMTLAKALQPRNLDGEPWYDLVADAIRQRQIEAEEASISQLERQHRLIQPELHALNANNATTALPLLRYIWTAHPPRSAFKLPDEINDDNMKKTLLLAIAAYHPDKNQAQDDADESAKKWEYLCTEITKMLNEHYARQFKS